MSLIKTLLVDDDYLVLEDLRQIINWEDLGFTIVGTASNGRQALELVEKENPGLIISDISMPVMDGFDFVETVKAKRSDLYFIFLSSYATFEYARRALQNEISSYILKNEISEQILTEHLEKAKIKINGRNTGTNEGLANQIKTYFEADLSEPDAELPIKDSYVFFYLTPQLPLEKLPDHFRRIRSTGSENLRDLSLVEVSLPDNTVLFSIEEFIVLCIPESFFLDGSYSAIYGVYNKIRHSLMQRNEKLMLYCHPCINTIDEEKRFFHTHQSEFHFFSTFSDSISWDLSSLSQMDKHKKSNGLEQDDFPYHILVKALENPDLFSTALHAYCTSCFTSMDSDLLFLFYHNLTIRMEELSDHMIPFEKNTLVSDKAELIALLQKRFLSIQSYHQRSHKNELSSWMNTAVNYMEEHYSDRELSVNDIAASVGLSSSRFSVLFRQETGQTVGDYLSELRIRKAIYLLENTNDKIYEIAEKVGYKTSQYFSQVFSQKTGHKPLHFRQKRPM